MTCAEDESPINRRRYQRYEIDTQLQVTLLGLEQRGTLRGRSLNISEAGIAGVFVTVAGLSGPRALQGWSSDLDSFFSPGRGHVRTFAELFRKSDKSSERR